METFLTAILYLHIAAGGTALITGLISIVAQKGKKLHRKSGKIYFWSMLVVAFSALVISIAKSNEFLLAIAVFSFYLNYNGWRALKNRSTKMNAPDWAVFAISVACAVYMVSTMNTVLMVFGALLAYLLIGKLRMHFKKEEDRKKIYSMRIQAHLGYMLGSYIATLTAFVVVNISVPQYVWLPWLAPTAIFLPLIFYWIRKERMKMEGVPAKGTKA